MDPIITKFIMDKLKEGYTVSQIGSKTFRLTIKKSNLKIKKRNLKINKAI